MAWVTGSEKLVAEGLAAGVGRVLTASEFLRLILGVQLPLLLPLASPVLVLVWCWVCSQLPTRRGQYHDPRLGSGPGLSTHLAVGRPLSPGFSCDNRAGKTPGLDTELQDTYRILPVQVYVQVPLANGDVYDGLVKTNPLQSSNTFIPSVLPKGPTLYNGQ